jgi:phage head maturation protease
LTLIRKETVKMTDAADFSGYATKAGLKCSDGRTINSKAFEHQDGAVVPLVWSHGHNSVDHVLGKVKLEHRADGTYGYAYFNNTPAGKNAKELVRHGDIESLSIYANKLLERGKEVLHGMIREVSLVFAGANPGAKIDFISFEHADGEVTHLEDEAVIFTGLALEHADGGSKPDAPASDSNSEDDEETIQDVYDSMNEKQKQVTNFMVAAALETKVSQDGAAKHGDTDDESDADNKTEDSTETKDSSTPDAGDGATPEDTLNHQEGNTMTVSHNVFESQAGDTKRKNYLSHADLVSIVESAKESGSFRKAVLAHAESLFSGKGVKEGEMSHADAATYGIEGIDMLFPDAKNLTNTPDFISRRMEWVSVVLNGTKHSPFAKVKSVFADITADEARAKGYVKGARKVEEVFKLLQRTTSPTTIYKKQKLDRDDILDITDMDVVLYLKGEMRLMIEEELARAILVGDGRLASNPDRVKDPEGSIDGVGIRSILHDDELYVIRRELAANVSPKDAVKGLVRARSKYRGSGKPTLFISDSHLTDMMLEEDKFGRSLWSSEAELADKLRVDKIVPVDLFDEYDNLFAIMVSLQDYTIGSNKGGELTSFNDFDIDFNQEKYLQETRLSGGLTKPFSAIVVTRGEGQLATATQPSFDGATNTITIPTSTGVVYTINDAPVTGDVVITQTTTVEAEPETGYYLASNSTRDWTYTP